jgi:putative membrane protein
MKNVVLAGVAVLALFGWQASVAAHQPGQPGKAKVAKAEAAKAAGGAADRAFVLEAASGGAMEVELGRMAASQASSDDVKKFGQRMVDDHSKANNDLSALAQKKNITVPAAMKRSHQATKDHLAKLNGAAFDKAYMQHMVADHVKDVRAFERESKMGKDADIKAWAGQVLPTLQDHLKQAKHVASAVGPAGRGR